MKEEDLFTNLPLEIMIDILSRLPIPTIMISCMRVCKSWRDMIESREFANSHLAKSAPLLVSQDLYNGQKQWKVFEFIDEEVNSCCNKSFSFEFPHPVKIKSSGDGLLVLSQQHSGRMRFYICNPITREYIELPPPNCSPNTWGIFGIGVSKITRQFKIVSVAHDKFTPLKCDDDVYIYTLGTGRWRRLQLNQSTETKTGVFLNGNLHWLASDDLNGTSLRIYCLDLETERFSTFSSLSIGYCYAYKCLTVMGDRLCFIGGDSFVVKGVVIWLMKEYGDEKSWTREFVINNCPWTLFPRDVYDTFPNIVARVCKNGELLLAVGYGHKIDCFSAKTNTSREINLPGLHIDSFIITFAYTPSFRRLKSFVKENVISL